MKINILACIMIFSVCIACNQGGSSIQYNKFPGYKDITLLEAKNNKDTTEYETLIKKYHDFALINKKLDITQEMITRAEKVYNQFKSNALIMSYYGSLVSLLGRDLKNPVKKMTAAKESITLIDNAVKLDSNNITVRLNRGFNSYNLPAFLNRIKTTITDFEFVTSLHESKKITLPQHLIADLYYKLGMAYKKCNQLHKAKTEWKKSIAVGAGTEPAREAKKQLNVYND